MFSLQFAQGMAGTVFMETDDGLLHLFSLLLRNSEELKSFKLVRALRVYLTG